MSHHANETQLDYLVVVGSSKASTTRRCYLYTEVSLVPESCICPVPFILTLFVEL